MSHMGTWSVVFVTKYGQKLSKHNRARAKRGKSRKMSRFVARRRKKDPIASQDLAGVPAR